MCSQGKPISEGRWAGSAGRGPWWGSGNINRAQLLLLLTRRGRWLGQGGRAGADGPDGAAGPAPRPRPLSRSISHLRLSSDGEPPVDTVPAPPPPGPPGPRGWCRPVLPAPGPVTHVEPERVPTAWLPGASLWGPPPTALTGLSVLEGDRRRTRPPLPALLQAPSPPPRVSPSPWARHPRKQKPRMPRGPWDVGQHLAGRQESPTGMPGCWRPARQRPASCPAGVGAGSPQDGPLPGSPTEARWLAHPAPGSRPTPVHCAGLGAEAEARRARRRLARPSANPA